MYPDSKHMLKAVALFAFGLFLKSHLLNGAGYSFLVHLGYFLTLILLVYKYLQSYTLPTVGDADFTALIVGAGFSGLGMSVKLKEMGVKFRIIEKSSRLGGTWRDNVYPGCECDVPSHLYSFSFFLNPDWSRSYAGQEEIFRYMEKIAKHFGLTDKIEFGIKAEKSTWNQETKRWHVKLSTGEEVIANVVISAVGGLHVPNIPKFEGQEETFRGEAFHSARWKKDYDPTDRTIAVIGTGASAVQVVPSMAKRAQQLFVFQRTPCWTGQKDDWAHPVWLRWIFKVFPPAMHLLRLLYFWRSELIFFLGVRTNSKYKNFVRGMLYKYMKKNVKDPELLKKLTPNYEVGCKRITPSNRYIKTFNQENVTLVTDPIKRFTEDGIETENGTEHKIDTIIYATGFSLLEHARNLDIRVPKTQAIGKKSSGQENGTVCNGVSGESSKFKELSKEWGDEPNAYLGIAYPGFPNSFSILGPGTGLGVGSLMLNLECQFSYICQCIRYMVEKDVKVMEVKREVNDEYQMWSRETIKNKAFAHASCTSWYRNKRGVTWTMWPTQPFFYWWYTMRLDPLDYNRK